MNEFYETYAARAKSGQTSTLGLLIAPVPQSHDHRPHMSDPSEELRNQSARMGRLKTRNQQTVFYVDDNPRALRVLTSVLDG